jgi:uncharacterized protein
MIMIDVFAMARTGALREGRCELSQMPRLAASLARRGGAIGYRCRGLTDERGRPAMDLELRATLALRCDRCGGDLDFELDVRRRFFFVAGEAELAAVEIDESPEEALVGSEHFDLQELVEDEAILQLPLSPRHPGCEPAAQAGETPQGRIRPFSELGALRDALRREAGPGEPAPAQGGRDSHGAAPGRKRRPN